MGFKFKSRKNKTDKIGVKRFFGTFLYFASLLS